MFLRNQFKSVGMFKLPLVKRQEISLEDVSLIGYDKVNQSNDYKSIVHFFLDDYKFESIYNNPEKKIEALRQFKAVLTPDFSMFVEMPIALQLFATFKNRWTGAYLQQQGIKVIPTVRWGDLTSFNFCFDGMKGDIIKVDYTKTNNLQKSNSGLYIKTFYGYVERTLSQKGGGSANGQNSGNPELTNTLPVKSKPNSKLVRYYNGKKIQERYYDENGKAKMDIDYTNHGNPKRHPNVPHKHMWINGRRMKTDE